MRLRAVLTLSGTIATALVSASDPPRFIVSAALAGNARLEVAIENPSPETLDTVLIAEIVLEPVGQRPRMPPDPAASYRARVGLGGVAATSAADATRLSVAPASSRTWDAQLDELLWHERVSGTRSLARPFRGMVPPGRYSLQVILEQDGPLMWRSGTISIAVDLSGSVSEVEPDRD